MDNWTTPGIFAPLMKYVLHLSAHEKSNNCKCEASPAPNRSKHWKGEAPRADLDAFVLQFDLVQVLMKRPFFRRRDNSIAIFTTIQAIQVFGLFAME